MSLKYKAWHKGRQEIFDVLDITMSGLNDRKKRAELNNGSITIWASLDEINLMPYTGALDRYDNEIYLDYIVRRGWHRKLFLVYWDKTSLMYNVAHPGGEYEDITSLYNLTFYKIQVVGHKYDERFSSWDKYFKEYRPKIHKMIYLKNWKK